MSWEDTFVSWTQGPGKTEEEKCQNAETSVKKAIAANDELAKMDVTVFTQGSYLARTNVRIESDVDLCVRLNSAAFCEYPEGKTDKDYGLVNSSTTFAYFKNLVGNALTSYFGAKSVKRGKKAFDVKATAQRVDADVLPAFEHRRYVSNEAWQYHQGIAFKTDDGRLIKNWPEQNYQNGVEKNDHTSRVYKRVVRIVKRLRNKMEDDEIVAARDSPSYLIECLVWNVPNEGFNHRTHSADVRYVLAHTFDATLNDERCNEWGEINELKYLFRQSQPWTRQQAHSLLSAAWDYVDFE